MTLTFSRRVALICGLLLPIVETIRRWPQLGDIRIWPDPAPIPAVWVLGIKGVGFLLAILALAGSLRHAAAKSG